MSKYHAQGVNHVPPKEGSRGYVRVVARGCGGRRYDTPDGVEYDCTYYSWSCDDCPWLREYEKFKHEFVGPPAPVTLGQWISLLL